MKLVRFSTNLENSSSKKNNFFPVLFGYVSLVLLLLFIGACSGTHPLDSFNLSRTETKVSPEPVAVRPRRRIPTPPWQLWRPVDSQELYPAQQALREGELQGAVDLYRSAIGSASTPMIRKQAQLCLAGTLLKLGDSKAALAEISKYANSENLKPTQLDPRFSLVASYAYIHQGDLDQSLAWFGIVYRATRGQGVFSHRAKKEASGQIRKLSVDSFDSFSQRWSVDAFAGPLFSAERLRRAQGGLPEKGMDPKWFSAAHYYPYTDAPSMAAVEEKSVEPEQTGEPNTHVSGQPLIVGVLLPLSGRFAPHALNVKKGIELAVEQYAADAQVRLVVVDTQTNPEVAGVEYERLVKEEGVSFVLGPLLVKTTEEVAEKSRVLGTPFIAFTKRGGVPSLGRAVFRLGATHESQVEELLSYAVGEQGMRSFAIAHPENTSGREFASVFRQMLAGTGAILLAEVGYYQGDENSISEAVGTIAAQSPQAVFIPDSLEGAFPFLEGIRTSENPDVVLLGPAQWNDPVAIRGYGQLIEGAVYVAPFNEKSERAPVVSFRNRYDARFGQEPELLAAQAYDATLFALRAINRPSASFDTIIERLISAEPFVGVTGKLSMTNSGEIARRMSVLQLRKGEAVEVMSAGVASSVAPLYKDKKSGDNALKPNSSSQTYVIGGNSSL